jgi:ferrochelatase
VGYDAVLLLSFGGPEGPDDVLPFLRNVVRGRGVPEDRVVAVAEHYSRFGGVSPINAQCRELLAALRPALDEAGVTLPLYWGNRNWHPYLSDTLATMRDEGVQRALAFVTSPYGSHSSCRQYLGDIVSAREAVGEGAPIIDKIRHFHDHPGFVEPLADGVRAALAKLGDGRLVFTAHSVPMWMAETSGPPDHPPGGRYVAQLRETAALVAARMEPATKWDLVWQSRSGSPHVPWLEPDINDHLAALASSGVDSVVISPIGFISDHLEVVWDLDTEVAATADRLGLRMMRAATPGTDPRFVAMVRDLVLERLDPEFSRSRLGNVPVWDVCPAECCPTPSRRIATPSR